MTRMPTAPRAVSVSGPEVEAGASEEPLFCSASMPWTMPVTVGLK